MVEGMEDSLRLSVFTPDLPVSANQRLMPVMVWICGELTRFERNK
jgi:carboxylesterase type B